MGIKIASQNPGGGEFPPPAGHSDGTEGAGWGPTARYPAKFGLKRVPRDPFRPNLFAFL